MACNSKSSANSPASRHSPSSAPTGRTPTRPVKRDFAALGRTLGVAHLVEGSVQRQGDTLRVSVKLVNAHDPAHPWSKQYSGKVADVFAIQREITREVATRLRADLSAGEQSALDRPLTTDPLAYDLYLRACQLSGQFKGYAAFRKGEAARIALLDEAVQRDPKFVEAYCLLAEATMKSPPPERRVPPPRNEPWTTPD